MKRVEFNRDFIFVLLVFVATSTLSNALLALNTRVQYISSAISGRGFPRFGQRQLLKQPHSLQSFASRYATAAVVADATRSSTWWRSKALLTKDLFSATAFIVSPSARKRAPVAPAAATTRLGEWLLGFGAVVAYQSGRLRSTVSPLFQHVKAMHHKVLELWSVEKMIDLRYVLLLTIAAMYLLPYLWRVVLEPALLRKSSAISSSSSTAEDAAGQQSAIQKRSSTRTQRRVQRVPAFAAVPAAAAAARAIASSSIGSSVATKPADSADSSGSITSSRSDTPQEGRYQFPRATPYSPKSVLLQPSYEFWSPHVTVQPGSFFKDLAAPPPAAAVKYRRSTDSATRSKSKRSVKDPSAWSKAMEDMISTDMTQRRTSAYLAGGSATSRGSSSSSTSSIRASDSDKWNAPSTGSDSILLSMKSSSRESSADSSPRLAAEVFAADESIPNSSTAVDQDDVTGPPSVTNPIESVAKAAVVFGAPSKKSSDDGRQGEWDDWENDAHVMEDADVDDVDGGEGELLRAVSPMKESVAVQRLQKQQQQGEWDDWNEEAPYFDEYDDGDDAEASAASYKQLGQRPGDGVLSTSNLFPTRAALSDLIKRSSSARGIDVAKSDASADPSVAKERDIGGVQGEWDDWENDAYVVEEFDFDDEEASSSSSLLLSMSSELSAAYAASPSVLDRLSATNQAAKEQAVPQSKVDSDATASFTASSSKENEALSTMASPTMRNSSDDRTAATVGAIMIGAFSGLIMPDLPTSLFITCVAAAVARPSFPSDAAAGAAEQSSDRAVAREAIQGLGRAAVPAFNFLRKYMSPSARAEADGDRSKDQSSE